MPTSAEFWYCEHIANGSLPYILLGLPLLGAYLYGQNKRRFAWLFIGAWIFIQIPMSYVTHVVFNCPGADEPPASMEAPGSVEPPGGVEAPAQPTAPAEK
jgi:hypothetical protein